MDLIIEALPKLSYDMWKLIQTGILPLEVAVFVYKVGPGELPQILVFDFLV